MTTKITIHRPIFKRDNKGNTRVWQIEQDGASYRVLSGILGGTIVPTGWTHAKGKRGRSDLQQAEFEVGAAYKFHLKREYFENEKDIDTPRFFKPMLARKYEKFSQGFAQPKLDGIRCVARKEGLFTREGQPIRGAPHIHETLMPVFGKQPELVFDGELYNHELKDDFNTIISLVRRRSLTPAI